MATTTLIVQIPTPLLRLEAVAGPPCDPIVIDRGSLAVVGRLPGSDILLVHPAVSRRHAILAQSEGGWTIADADSRHGTTVNGVKLESMSPAPLASGDLVGLGPWLFAVRIGDQRTSGLTTFEDEPGALIESVADVDLGNLARQRLEALMCCAEGIHAAKDEAALGRAVVEAAVVGTGFPLGAVLRPSGAGEEVEAIAAFRRDGREARLDRVSVSRSLIRAAATTRSVARVRGPDELPDAVSIAALGIRAAMCAPVLVGESVQAFVYLDSRDDHGPVESDSIEYIAALSRMFSIALSNLHRREFERRQIVLESDLRAARQAQERLMPASSGSVANASYTLHWKPGRIVAGDLFDVVNLPNGDAAFFLGDVSGKGMGAALVMATARHLRAMLERDRRRRGGDAPQPIASLARGRGRFLSLWLGVLSPGKRTLRFVDAGHGYAALAPRRGSGAWCRTTGCLSGSTRRSSTAPSRSRSRPATAWWCSATAWPSRPRPGASNWASTPPSTRSSAANRARTTCFACPRRCNCTPRASSTQTM